MNSILSFLRNFYKCPNSPFFMYLLLILAIIVGFIYIISMQGITCCNSGSLYALVRAIVDKKKFSIDEYIKYTKFLDYSKRKNNYYTDRPPGLSFAAIPFYFLKINVVFLPLIAGLLSSMLIYLISYHLIPNELLAFFAALIFSFCTINWRYSTTFILHPLSTFLILLSVYFLLLGYPVFLIGLLIGFATIVEYTDALFFLGIFIFFILQGTFIYLPMLTLGYLIGVIPLLIYNFICFGSPFTTSYKYSGHFKWSNSPKTTFVTPLWKGMLGLLFYIPRKRGIRVPGGLLIMSPILILGIIGLFYLPENLLELFLLLILPLFIVMSKHKTWWAGGAGDYRYLSAIVPFLVIPIIFALVNLPFLLPLAIILSVISLIMMISKMILLTITPEDLHRLDEGLLQKVKKRKLGLLEFFSPRYLSQIGILIFDCLFIRKIHLEKTEEFTNVK
jgi:hypothetical protein